MKPEGIWKLRFENDAAKGGFRKGDIVEVSEMEAIRHLSAKEAWLIERPKVPPWLLLDQLRRKVQDLHRFGPPIDNHRQIAKLTEVLFPGGLRQTFVEDRSINWVCSKVGLRDLVGRELSAFEPHDFDLFALFRFVSFSLISSWQGSRAGLHEHLHVHEFARDRAEEKDDMAVLVHWPGVDSDWKEFTFYALCLSADFEAIIGDGISQGRILMCQSTPAGDRFIHPDIASKAAIMDFDSDHWFAFSSNIPLSIVNEKPPLEWRRSKASKWMSDAVTDFAKKGLRVTGARAQSVASHHFELSPNAAKDAWKFAETPATEAGNVKSSLKVCEDELRNHANMWREK